MYVNCRYCKKPLTDTRVPGSRTLGYGPDCAAERGLPHPGAPAPRARRDAAAGQADLFDDDPDTALDVAIAAGRRRLAEAAALSVERPMLAGRAVHTITPTGGLL